MVDYTVIKQKRKLATIHVQEDLKVIVKVPNTMTQKQIKAFVERYEPWVQKTLNQKAIKRQQTDWLRTGKILYQGDYKEIRIQKIIKGKEKIVLQEDLLILNVKENATEETLRLLMKGFYKSKAQELLPQLTDYYAQLLGVTYEKVTIRQQKTRWGSCSSKGNIAYNLNLMGAPINCIHYVVLHEVMHRCFFDHSSNFWKGIEEIMPDYKDRVNDLKIFGQNFSI